MDLSASLHTLSFDERANELCERSAADTSSAEADQTSEFEPRNACQALHELLIDLGVPSKSLEAVEQDLKARATNQYPQTTNLALQQGLVALTWLNELKPDHPYSLLLYLTESEVYLHLCYPDLAAGSAYKALLLSDAVRDESDEYHEGALESLQSGLHRRCRPANALTELPFAEVLEELDDLQVRIYCLLGIALQHCQCYRSAHQYVAQGRKAYPNNLKLQRLAGDIEVAANITQFPHDSGRLEGDSTVSAWQDEGSARRERYPWNDHEPQRLKELEQLNVIMSKVAPKLEVKAVFLPNLIDPTDDSPAVMQLGVFAKVDLSPDDVVLEETSLLTANNRLQDALCDACNADLPDVRQEETALVACADCEVVFCSQDCHDMAQKSYHPALCERDVDAIAKDTSPEQAADSLYALLLLRTLAMAETQECHPLDLQEVKYIWGDFLDVDADKAFNQAGTGGRPSSGAFPTTLPFSFEHNIRLPFHMLEKMDIDIFANPQYDVWVFNTLYAKFRGTASARLSGLGGRAIRGPEVCAVHPMWCLANHSCDPNVSWQWGGSIAFTVRRQRVAWHGDDGEIVKNAPGIRAGEEVLNHYCDLELPVAERRAWARGALGGDCMCSRCIWESQQAPR